MHFGAWGVGDGKVEVKVKEV